MEIELTKKPTGATLIEGFPGLGFVGTVAVEYLLEHLKAEPIGQIKSIGMPPLATIHAGEVRQLLEIFYCKKHNLIFLHALSSVKGLEWALSNTINDLIKELKIKEVISIEGVGSPFQQAASRVFYHSDNEKCRRKLAKAGAELLSDGIVVGVTGALLMNKPKDVPSSFIFVETHSKMPDSKAAAEIIRVLDSYFGLKVDPKPLEHRAGQVQEKIKELMQKVAQTKDIKEKKEVSYIG